MAQPVTVETITLSEFAVGTVDPKFTFRGILANNRPLVVTIDGVIIEDGADPTSPAIAGDETAHGPVTITFSSPVSAISFDAGAFNNAGSTRIVIEGRRGFRVETVLNTVDTAEYEHFDFDFKENAILKVKFIPVAGEDFGFAVDNIEAILRPEARAAVLAKTLAIDNLIAGTRWNGTDIAYSFVTTESKFPGYGTGPTTFFESDVRANAPLALRADQKDGVELALEEWAGAAPLNFSETVDTDDPGMLRLAVGRITNPADAHYPGQHPEAGDVWIRTGNATRPVKGNYDYYVFLHEIGHALGLKHPHDAGLGPRMPALQDSHEYSVMSYRSYAGMPASGAPQNAPNSMPQTLMMNDIAAIQHLYGANFEHELGDKTYRFNPLKAKIFETIWDGGGTDSYDLSNYTSDLRIDLAPGHSSTFATSQLAVLKNSAPMILARGNVYNALLYRNDQRSLIENASGGTGNDSIAGNQGRNVLEGGDGNDTLGGLAQADRLLGQDGNDQLSGGFAADELTGGLGLDRLTGGAGADKFMFGALAASRGASRDAILDFTKGQDDIVLSLIDANAEVDGNQAFAFAGASAAPQAGQVGYWFSGQNTLVSANVDSDPAAELQILLTGRIALGLGDFEV